MSDPSEARVAAGRDPDDIDAAAKILLRSFAGRENARLGASYARAVVRSFMTASSRSLHVAWVDGRLAGFAAGEAAAGRAARYRTLRPIAATAFLQRPWIVFDPAIRHMLMSRLAIDSNDFPPRESWFLPIIAVDPDFQGRGLGHKLLHSFEQEGHRRGFGEASLVVLESNMPARTLYEHAGWTISGPPAGGRVGYKRSLGADR